MNDFRKEFWENQKIIDEFSNKKISEYIEVFLKDLFKRESIKNALDIGCGAGRYSFYLLNQGINVTAIDRHEKLAFRLKDTKACFIPAEMDKLPLKSDFFDLVLSIGVLHNALSVQEFQNSISEVARVLKTKKIFVCSVFTDDVISKELKKTDTPFLFLTKDKLPMLLLSKKHINNELQKNKLIKICDLNEHVTNVGTGLRNVYTFVCQKK